MTSARHPGPRGSGRPRPARPGRPPRPGRRGGRRDGRSSRGAAHVRLRVALVLITMLMSVFAARLLQLQGVDSKAYASRADASGLVTVTLPAKRGEILDRNGVPLAESVTGSMLVADPLHTAPDAQAIAKLVASKLDLDYFDLLDKLSKKGSRFVYLARRIPSTVASEVVDELRAKKYVGVDTEPDPLRYYPSGDVAANLIGFLNDAGEPGAGFEQTFDKTLAGKDGTETYEVGGGNRIPLGDNSEVDPVNGHDLKLTIDRDVQWYAQRVLRTAVEGAQAESGTAVVMDTRTGELLAFADYPTYDANKPGQASPDELGAHGLTDLYEPGSVEKVFTVSGLVDSHKVTPATRFTVPNTLPVADRVIHDWFDHPTLNLTMAGVIAQSSNIGTSMAATQFTPAQLWHYLDAFGLGHVTDVGVQGESQGLLPAPSTWSPLTRAQISFGQGLGVTALQMAAGVNTIANGGTYVSPSLVEGSVRTAGGSTVGTGTTTQHRVVSASAARQTAEMMEMVTTEGSGTAPGAGIPGYRVAGKTGTAQEVGGRCKCYEEGGLDVSFSGFAPADDPRFTVYVVIKKPAAGASGGGTAGPVFRKILSYVLQKYSVPPTGTAPAALPVQWGRNPGSLH